jgi:hypothetical protein
MTKQVLPNGRNPRGIEFSGIANRTAHRFCFQP